MALENLTHRSDRRTVVILAQAVVGNPRRLCGIRMYSMTMSGTCATHVLTKAKTESCLVKAPAMHASESVLVVSELLCTGVQANTERHTRNENARNVLMLGIQTTLLLTQFERVA